MARPLSVLIADDDPIVREVMATIARSALDCADVLYADDLEEAIARARSNPQLSLIVVDPSLSAFSSIEGLRQLHSCCPRAGLLVLSRTHRLWESKELLEAGATGFVFKENLRVISLAIQMIMADGTCVPVGVPEPRSSEPDADALRKVHPGLTKRRIEVLRLILQGYANSAIAAHLNISEGTVKQHIHAIFMILGVSSRTEAAAAAMKLGLT